MNQPKNQLPRIRVPSSSTPFFIVFSSLLFLSSACPAQEQYFINCGSKTTVALNGRDFVGDLNSSSFCFTKKHSSIEEDPHPSSDKSSSVYQTARIFEKASSYNFHINDNKGIYIVRLHFFAFSSSSSLPAARFNVLASGSGPSSGFTLLSNFSVQSSKSSAPQVQEFMLSVKAHRFAIHFVPQNSSFAFINAIEVFLVPDNLIPQKVPIPQISPKGRLSDYKGLQSQVLRTVHRINVGGSKIKAKNDALWRNWVPDDSFLNNPEAAENQSGSLSQEFDRCIAPDEVYETAKVVRNPNSSMRWDFNVSRSTKHFVRLHFYDFVGETVNALIFDLFIYSSFNVTIDPQDHYTSEMGDPNPFHIDYVVDSDEVGLLNISIGPKSEMLSHKAFLNGVEIMEINEGLVPVRTQACGKTKLVFVVAGAALGGIALMCIFAVVVLLFLRKSKLKQNDIPSWSPLRCYKGGVSHCTVTAQTTNSVGSNLNLELRVPFSGLKFATKNFSGTMLIGKGGFGNVYKGILRDGTKVAVKRAEPGSGQGFSEFQTEIVLLSKIRHRHLVSLIGYCDDNNEMILVYEFMERGTLREHLYDSNLPPLPWKQRLEICIGAARGLHYLHSGSSGVIIHRDVKSTNILLDENHIAKVADFGLSRSGCLDQAYITTDVKGTFGYLDPEYLQTHQLTEKSDVYAFGVVLLEVLCARPAINTSLPREEVNLAEWGVLHAKKGLLDQIADLRLAGQINPNSFRKFSETVEKCLEENGADRPSMGDVAWDLEYALQLQRNVVQKQPHEDSATGGSLALPESKVQRLPSLSSSVLFKPGDNSSEFASSEVFSQLEDNEPR